MAAITVRNLSDAAHQALKERARKHGRSMEAEARELIEQVAQRQPLVDVWLDGIEDVRGDFPLPERSIGKKPPDFS